MFKIKFNGFANYTEVPELLNRGIISTVKLFSELRTSYNRIIMHNSVQRVHDYEDHLDFYLSLESLMPKNKAYEEGLKVVKGLKNNTLFLYNTHPTNYEVHKIVKQVGAIGDKRGLIFMTKEQKEEFESIIHPIWQGIYAVLEVELIGLGYTYINSNISKSTHLAINATNSSGNVLNFYLHDISQSCIDGLSNQIRTRKK